MEKIRQLWKNILQTGFWKLGLFFALIGPGIITSNVDNDAGGITTYSLAGAHYGLNLLWILIPVTVALIIIQEMCARMGVVSGKGLSDLIRERFGAKITFYLMIILFLANMGNTFQNLPVLPPVWKSSASVNIFPCRLALFLSGGWWSREIINQWKRCFWLPVSFIFPILFPDFWCIPTGRQSGIAAFTPTLNFDTGMLTMAIGIIGTTIAPWMQFYLQSSIVDKGLKAESYKYARMDVIFGSITVNVVAFFIIMLCAVTLFQNGLKIETAKDAALGAGSLGRDHTASWLFAFGLLNASLFAASILPLSTAYTICEAFGWESSLNTNLSKRRSFTVFIR